MSLYFITGSEQKLAEARVALPDIEQLEIDLPEIQEIDPHKIIAAKLFEARKHHGNAYIVDDTSLTLDGMNGLPGPLIKWFLETIGPEGLYKLGQTFGSGVTARCTIGYTDENGTVTFFEGITRGTIVEPKVKARFGWDGIFLPEGHDKTYAEMSIEEKGAISHRGKALKKLAEFLNR